MRHRQILHVEEHPIKMFLHILKYERKLVEKVVEKADKVSKGVQLVTSRNRKFPKPKFV